MKKPTLELTPDDLWSLCKKAGMNHAQMDALFLSKWNDGKDGPTQELQEFVRLVRKGA